MNVIQQISFLIALGMFFQSPLLAMKRKLNEESPKPIYEILAQQEIDEEQKFNQEYDGSEDYQRWVKKFKRYEEHLCEIEENPRPSMWGGINYTMTLDEMKEKTKEKFIAMKNDGLIISTTGFEKIKGKYYLGKKHTDLTRIWGADYLREKINASEALRDRYDVPKYIIVTQDPDNLELDLYFGHDYYPIVRRLTNATIYFEKVRGSSFPGPKSLEKACNADIGIESGICYVDFADPGNVMIQDGTEKYYIVDTEYQSFDMQLDSTKLSRLLEYAHDRFRYLNPTKDFHSFQIDLL